jgi:transposase
VRPGIPPENGRARISPAAISDLSGVTGMAILRAIVAGERNPHKLAKLRDVRIQASEEEIAHSLEGNWRKDVLFELKQMLNGFNFCQKQIAECDEELQKYLAELPSRESGKGKQ